MQGDDELGGGDRLALGLIGDRQDALDRLDARLDRLLETAVLLDGEHRRLVSVAQMLQDLARDYNAPPATPKATRKGNQTIPPTCFATWPVSA